MSLVLFSAAPPDAGYPARMAAALRALGHDVAWVALAGGPDAVASGRAAWKALPKSALPIIDGTALPTFAVVLAEDAEPATAGRAVGLLHRPLLAVGEAEGAVGRLLARLARVIVPTETLREKLIAAFGLPHERLAVVAPGTDDAPRSEGSGGPGCAILCAAPLCPCSGQDALLRALARLFDLDWRLTIAGDPSDAAYAEALYAAASEHGIADRVAFAAEPDARHWHGADLFALPLDAAGESGGVAEALKRGLPVAVGSGAAWLVPEDAGVVCAPDDVEQLSKALRRLIFDTSLRQDMAERAWQAGRALPDWSTQASALAAVLSQSI